MQVEKTKKPISCEQYVTEKKEKKKTRKSLNTL